MDLLLGWTRDDAISMRHVMRGNAPGPELDVATHRAEEVEAIGRSIRAHWASFARGEALGPDWQAATATSFPLNVLPR